MKLVKSKSPKKNKKQGKAKKLKNPHILEGQNSPKIYSFKKPDSPRK